MKNIAFEVILVILAGIASVVFYVFDSISPGQTYFQRSGVLIVISGIMLQFKNDRLYMDEIRNAIDLAGSGLGPYGSYHFDNRKWIVNTSYVYMIFGSIISGFGDILIK